MKISVSAYFAFNWRQGEQEKSPVCTAMQNRLGEKMSIFQTVNEKILHKKPIGKQERLLTVNFCFYEVLKCKTRQTNFLKTSM